jgi:hypothetical protein
MIIRVYHLNLSGISQSNYYSTMLAAVLRTHPEQMPSFLLQHTHTVLAKAQSLVQVETLFPTQSWQIAHLLRFLFEEGRAKTKTIRIQ